jgi:hypothetical protein
LFIIEVESAVGTAVTGSFTVEPLADATTPARPPMEGIVREAGGREIAGMLCASKL